jgi:hypothetical protein
MNSGILSELLPVNPDNQAMHAYVCVTSILALH